MSYWLNEATYSAKQRKALAARGLALPDGSFPIANKAALKDAVLSYGQAKNKAQAKAWITRRAKALDATDLLPADWAGSTKKAEAAAGAPDPYLTEAERSVQQINDAISSAARKEFGGADNYPWDCCASWNIWVCDTYEEYVVINVNGTLYSFPWAIDADGDVTFGDPTEVIPGYKAAADVTGDGDGDADDGVLAVAGIPEALRKAKAGVELGEGMRPLFDALDAALVFAEAGRTLSKANEDKLRGAIKTMSDHVDSMTGMTEDEPDPASEAAADVLTGDYVPLLEKALRRDGTVPLKVIQPGWGSSGYYSPELLERDGPRVFTAGTKMYWNHPTPAEEAARPERDLRDLAAELTGDARWEAAGPSGPGLYADAKVFGPFKEAVEELAPHIGVSIRAMGKAKAGVAEGKKGSLIEELTSAHSIDFVTVPGAGGQVLSLFESARGRTPEPGTTKTKENSVEVDERAYQLLKESRDQALEELARLREGQMLLTAKQHVRQVLEKRYADVLPAVTIDRLTEALAKNPPLADDKIDFEGYGAIIHEAAKSELDYLAKITGSGKVRGMGGSPEPFQVKTDLAESQAKLADAFGRIGLHKDAAALAAAGRS